MVWPSLISSFLVVCLRSWSLKGDRRGAVGSSGMAGLEGSREEGPGVVTGSFSESELVKPVSLWTKSLKVLASAWTKVVGDGDDGDEIMVWWWRWWWWWRCLSILLEKVKRETEVDVFICLWEKNFLLKIMGDRNKFKVSLRDCVRVYSYVHLYLYLYLLTMYWGLIIRRRVFWIHCFSQIIDWIFYCMFTSMTGFKLSGLNS